MEPGRERKLVTAGVMAGIFLGALEATAVTTAMPTAVSELGGVDRYSWVFSIYLLAATTTGPLYGKLADLFGRRRVYLSAAAMFIAGTVLCGTAGSFELLIAYRALQGLGAGGIMPVAVTVVGDIYTLEERARMQGLLSGVWAVSSLLGPLVGGLLTDALSWRAVFYVSVPFALLSAWLIHRYLPEEKGERRHRLDVAGTVLLSAAVVALLFGLTEGGGVWGWGDPRTLVLFAAFAVLLALFVRQERRAPEPILPPSLMTHRVIAVSSLGNTLLGGLLYTVTSFLPVLVQGPLGGSAAEAGLALAPALVSWPISSTLSARLMFRVGYRNLALTGAVVVTVAVGWLAQVDAGTSLPEVMAAMFLSGLGMGALSMPYLLGVQNAVPRRQRGIATSTVQFFRSIGGAVAVAALGAILTSHLTGAGLEGLDPNAILQPEVREGLSAVSLAALEEALLAGLRPVYLAGALLGVAGFVVAWWFPRGSVESLSGRD